MSLRTLGEHIHLFATETLKGKDVNRILLNLASREIVVRGEILDVGGGDGRASYWRYFVRKDIAAITTLDVNGASGADLVIDLEGEDLPQDKHFDTALLYNVLEHVSDPAAVVRKVLGVLRPDGRLIIAVPFLVKVHPDPHDYQRFTDEGLLKLLSGAGLTSKVVPIGTGPFAASYSQLQGILPRVITLIVLPFIFLGDWVVGKFRPHMRIQYPLSYLAVAYRQSTYVRD